MKARLVDSRILVFVMIGAMIGMTGCLSMQNHSTLDEIQDLLNGPPYVEAYIDYPGPQEKWAGPAHFSLHVVAKEAGAAQVSVIPALFNNLGSPGGGASARSLASGGASPLGAEEAREKLKALASALQGADTTFRGCLSPVRVRILRADGSVLEKQGCRGQNGWVATASEAVDFFISTTLYGKSGKKPNG